MVLNLVDGKLRFDEQLLRKIQQKKNKKVLSILKSEVVCTNSSDDTGSTLLHFASQYGNAKVAQHLLSLGVNVNAQDELGQTPLLLAVTRHVQGISNETIKVLLKAGANFLKPDIKGKYPLQHVVDNRKFPLLSVVKCFFESLQEYCQNDAKWMADLLVQAGCSIERVVYLNNAAVTEIMIKAGCEVDALHPRGGFTALHVAARYMDEPNVKLLLAYGADATAQTVHGILPLAAYLYGANIEPYQPNLEILKVLMSHYFTAADKTEETMMSFRHILYKGNQEEIQCMLQYDIDLSVNDMHGSSFLHWLIRNTHPNVAKPFEDKIKDANLRNMYECTALHYVALACNPDTVRFLLDHGADVNAKTLRGNTPLTAFFIDVSTEHSPREKEVIELLLEHGADIQVVVPEDQNTIFDLAVATERFNLGEMFVARLVLLEIRGKPIIDLIRRKIDAHHQFKAHYDLCRQQLDDMKKITVYETITLFKLLTQSKKEITRRYAYNDELIQEFEIFDVKYCSKPNYYYDILRARIESVLPKIQLIRDATDIIFMLMAPVFNNNYLVVRKIIDCLDDADMKVLNKI